MRRGRCPLAPARQWRRKLRFGCGFVGARTAAEYFSFAGRVTAGRRIAAIPAVGKRDGNSGSVPTGVTNKTLAYDRTTVIGNGVIASVCA